MGDYFADPEREIVKWTGFFYEGKFYLENPLIYSKLQEVEEAVELEKKIAESCKASERHQAESVRSYEQLNESGYSYATVHDAKKNKIKQVKVEKDLVKEEENNFKRVVEARNKKKEEVKKPTKNLIEIKRNK